MIIDISNIKESQNPSQHNSVPRIEKYTCEEYLVPITLIGLFGELNENISKLKTVFFLYMRRRRRSRFNKLINLQNQVSLGNIRIDNVIQEYRKARPEDLREGTIEHEGLANEKKKLSEIFIENVDFVIDETKKILDPVNMYVKEYFANENVKANYRLQRIISLLTLVICVLTIIQFHKEIGKAFLFFEKAINNLIKLVF
jgi:hypothetical protein